MPYRYRRKPVRRDAQAKVVCRTDRRANRSYALWFAFLFMLLCIWALNVAQAEADPYQAERERLVDHTIARGSLLGRDAVEDEQVLEAIRTTPRHEFVAERHRDQAYADRPLPIGHGQTISQPYIVAIMTEMLEVEAGDRVLEIGTGSGYHAAVIAAIVDDVYTMEIVEPLGEAAKERLERLDYDNVHVRLGDGYHGWEEHAPYDGIVVTAAAAHIPPPLVEQLKPGGKMVIPVGPPFMTQNLVIVSKLEDGSVRQRNVMPVRFVPFTRADEDEEED